MKVPTPDHLRREVLRLDMHDYSAPEIAAQTGVNRSTVEYIIRRTRGPHEYTHRGSVTLLRDPAEIFTPGARFSADDIRSWADIGGLVDGTLFEIARRDGSVYCAEVRGRKLVRMSA